MSSKKQPPEDSAARRRSERFLRAQSIKETWPFVSTFTFELKYSGSDKEPRPFHYGPDDKAFFDRPCHYHECFQGGFELTHLVSKMVEDRGEEISGELHCPGWLGEYRPRPIRCDATLKYRITVRYLKSNGDVGRIPNEPSTEIPK